MKRFASLMCATLAIALLAGCGGGGSESSSGVAKSVVQIAWPARTKQPIEPKLTSALSAKLTFSDPLNVVPPADVRVNRSSSTAAYIGVYDLPANLNPALSRLTVLFYSQGAQAGALVGTASANVNLANGSPVFESILMEGTIKSVAVVPVVLTVGGPATQLEFSAKDKDGKVVAVSAGSGAWALNSGAAFLGLTSAGLATPLSVGTAQVTVTLDNIKSPAAPIQVKNFESNLEWVDITQPSLGNYLKINAVQGSVIAGQRGINVNGSLTEYSGGFFAPTPQIVSPMSEILGVDGTSAAGFVEVITSGINVPQAIFVTPSRAQVNLHPAGANTLLGDGVVGSKAYDVDGSTQVGHAAFAKDKYQTHAVLWKGSAGTVVDLHPDDRFPATASPFDEQHPTAATHISGTLIAGFFAQSPYLHACAWTDGTKFSFVELTPATYFNSKVTAVENGRMVGYGKTSAGDRPILWRGPTKGQAVTLPTSSSAQHKIALYLTDNYIVGIDENLSIWNAANLIQKRFNLPTLPTGLSNPTMVGARKTAAGLDVVYRVSETNIGGRLMLLKVPTNLLP